MEDIIGDTDSVLLCLSKSLSSFAEWSIYADLPSFPSPSLISGDTSKPDLILHNKCSKFLYIVERTVQQSTVDQLIPITHTIFNAFECNPPLEVRSVYVDISKAFGRVWHDGLIFKLKRCGVMGDLFSLIKNFLTGRKQRTVLNGKSSSWGDISAGVPQVSIQGRLFFLVYISDLTKNLECNDKLFADDTSLFTVVQDYISAANDMNHDLELIRLWADDWRIKFNPDPQKQAVELTFSRRKIVVNHPNILFNITPVTRVKEHEHLGIILDSNLSFSAHI